MIFKLDRSSTSCPDKAVQGQRGIEFYCDIQRIFTTIQKHVSNSFYCFLAGQKIEMNNSILWKVSKSKKFEHLDHAINWSKITTY